MLIFVCFLSEKLNKVYNKGFICIKGQSWLVLFGLCKVWDLVYSLACQEKNMILKVLICTITIILNLFKVNHIVVYF